MQTGAVDPSGPIASGSGTPLRAKLLRALQVAVTLAAFGYVSTLVSLDALLRALAGVSLASFGIAVLLTVVGLGFGTLRWWLLLRAFGAPNLPALPALFHHYLVGFFYNVCLPGGVGGDVVRAVAARRAFGSERATTASLATVLVERIFGLAGLLGLVSIVSLVHPLPALGSALLPALLGVCGAVTPPIALAAARRLAGRGPRWLGARLRSLPQIVRVWPLIAAAAVSVATHVLPALSGYLLLRSLASDARLLDAFAIVPLAAAAAFVPITVSGAGVREAVFVKLYESVGVAASSALATSLLLWCSLLCVAAMGGLYALRGPLRGAR